MMLALVSAHVITQTPNLLSPGLYVLAVQVCFGVNEEIKTTINQQHFGPK